MKVGQLKNLIKEAVKEVIQSELKEILLEAIKAPKQPIHTQTVQTQAPVLEQRDFTDNNTPPNTNLRTSYLEILNETANPKPAGNFVVNSSDVINGTLHEGEVGMDQITQLMKGNG